MFFSASASTAGNSTKMLSEKRKRKRKHSLEVQSLEPNGSDVKKRKKEASGKEKCKRKHADGLQKGNDAKVQSDGDDLRNDMKKKKKKKRSKTEVDNDNDITNQSLRKWLELDQEKKRVEGEMSSDTQQEVKESKRREKKKKEPQESQLREEEDGIIPNKLTSKPRRSMQEAVSEAGNGRGQNDKPAANGVKKASNDYEKPVTSFRQPTSAPNALSKDPTNSTAEPSDKPVDGELRAVSRKQGQEKKKKKRRKSQLGDEESSIKPTQSPAQPCNAAQKAMEEDTKRVQPNEPHIKRLKGREYSSSNETQASKPKVPASDSNIFSKDLPNGTTKSSGKHTHEGVNTGSRQEDLSEKKKKRRRKSQLGDEECDIERPKCTAHSHESVRKEAVEERTEIEKSDKPPVSGEKRKASSENSTISVGSRQPASGSENLSKETTNKPSEQSDDDKPLDDKRLPRTLFVGNVPQTSTRKQLRKIFSEYSPIESIRIRNVIPVNPKIPKKAALLAGRLAQFSNSFCAYVVFKEAENMEQVLERAIEGSNMTMFQDHHLRVSKAVQTKGKRRQSVFIGNLPFDCTDEELIRAFMSVAKECGVRLTNARVNRDSDTGVGRGCGFATFDDIMGIQACLNKDGEIKVRGRALRIERAFKTKNMKSKSYKRKWKNAFGQRES